MAIAAAGSLLMVPARVQARHVENVRENVRHVVCDALLY
jgi:hypothetical protein